MGEFKLAEGESVVRTYRCTGVDRCKVIAGTAIPLKSAKSSAAGTMLVTNKRLIYHMENASKQGGIIHREVRISDISSVSSVVSMFGRDIRVTVALILLGFIMMFAPFVYATETGMLDDGIDYREGYNTALENAYYIEYLAHIVSGDVENTIPEGYEVPDIHERGSTEYVRGAEAGAKAGYQRADEDAAAGKAFSVPNDLKVSSTTGFIIPLALVGMFVFISGSILYVISSRTKNWIRLDFGGGSGAGLAIKSMSAGEDRNGASPLTTDEEYYKMIGELGSVITELRLTGKVSEVPA